MEIKTAYGKFVLLSQMHRKQNTRDCLNTIDAKPRDFFGGENLGKAHGGGCHQHTEILQHTRSV